MHPDRGIVRMYIRSDGLSTIPYDQNTLTHQSTDMNDDPRDYILSLVTKTKKKTEKSKRDRYNGNIY